MQQVLTVPPTRVNKYWKFLGYVSKALYVMPLMTYGLLFYHEWNTRNVGYALGWDKMKTLLSACGFFCPNTHFDDDMFCHEFENR